MNFSILDTLQISLIYNINNFGPSTEPCGAQHVTLSQIYHCLFAHTNVYLLASVKAEKHYVFLLYMITHFWRFLLLRHLTYFIFAAVNCAPKNPQIQ